MSLNLSHNAIQKIENLNENYFLLELDLSYNFIEKIENLENLNCNILNLMNNNLREITGLDDLNMLMHLNLAKNSISKLKGLQNLEKLRYLYLSSNKISRAKQVAYLTPLKFLTTLDLCFNDVQTRKFYRYKWIYHLPQLRTLDGQDVTSYEKVKANNFFGENLHKCIQIFNNYLPDEDFIDRRLFVKEQIDPESDSEEENREIDKYEGSKAGSSAGVTANNLIQTTLSERKKKM